MRHRIPNRSTSEKGRGAQRADVVGSLIAIPFVIGIGGA
jgi:hypothetical protein